MVLIKTKTNYQWDKKQVSPNPETGEMGEEKDVVALTRQLQLMVKDMRDDIFQLNPTLFTTLPTAEEDKRGSFVIKEASSVEDLLNICIRDASAAFLFKTIALNVNKKGADVASATSMTLGNDGDCFDITGTTTITSITIRPVGDVVKLQFDGVLTLTDGSNLKLNGDFVTAAESTIMLKSDGTNWFELSRSPTVDTTTSFFAGSFSRDISLTGDQAVTGVGFTPKLVIFRITLTGVDGGHGWGWSNVTDEDAGVMDLFNSQIDRMANQSGKAIGVFPAASKQSVADLTAFGSDGFTLNWSGSGSPTGTAVVHYVAMG